MSADRKIVRPTFLADSSLLTVGALIASLLVAAAVGHFFVWGGMQHTDRIMEEQKKLTAELGYLTELIRAVERGSTVMESLQVDLDELEKQVPTSMDFQAFYADITRLTKNNDVLIASIRPGDIQEVDKHSQMLISITANASFAKLHGFLADLSTLKRQIKFEHLAIRPNPETGRCDSDFSLYIYATSGG